MSVALYMDENVHRAIALGLRRRGVDVMTAQEDGRAGAPDDLVLARAMELGRVLFSQDRDMFTHATMRMRNGLPFAGLAYADQLGITIGAAVDSLELLAKASDPDDIRDRIEFLPY